MDGIKLTERFLNNLGLKKEQYSFFSSNDKIDVIFHKKRTYDKFKYLINKTIDNYKIEVRLGERKPHEYIQS